MFDDNDYLKQKLRDFLKDEIDEIQQHKVRFFVLFFSLLISIALIFTEDANDETIIVNDASQIEGISNDPEKTDDKNKDKTLNKRVISVKKSSDKSNGATVVAVLGANSDELYVGDPFQSEEEKPAVIQQKDSKSEVIPQQVPIIPPQLPPVPDQIPNLPPIPSVTPQEVASVPESVRLPEENFILTGTVINLDKKSAIVQKISTVQGKNVREENLIVGIGDYLEGHQIVDITAEAVIFDDGHRINSNYLSSHVSISTSENDIRISEIPVADYAEVSINPVSAPDSDVPVISDSPDDYPENLIGENDFKIPDIVVENPVSVDDDQNLIQIDDEKLSINSSPTDKSSTFDTDEQTIDFPVDVDIDVDTFINNSDNSLKVLGDSLILGNSSP